MKEITKLSWIINNACNLKCVHCYPNSGIETKRDFTDEEFDKLYENLKDIHFKRIFISGGEPILDKNIDKYIDIAKKIGDEVCICSNGVLLTDKRLLHLKELGINGIVLSLQAIDKESSLSIYGNELVFDAVMKAIDNIPKYELSLSVEITMMKKNLLYIDDIVSTLICKGVKAISFKRLLPVGRGEKEGNAISREENFKMLNKIADWQVEYSDVKFNVHDPLYAVVLYERFKDYIDNNPRLLDWIKGFSCRAGTRWIGVSPEGEVSPCPILLYKDVIIGNVMRNKLIDILGNSTLIEFLQQVEDNPGKNCKYNSICLGCRATAIAKNNDFFAIDPMCVEKNSICPICSKKERCNEDYS